MLQALIKDKVYYKIFDKTFQHLTYIYNIHKAKDAAKLAEVKNNLALTKQELAAEQIVVLEQTHSNIVIDVDNISDFDQQPKGDALVATKSGIALGIVTADCVPVLISSDDGKVIGAAHCGWKGTKNNIINNLIETMKSKNARFFKAVIGPCIAQASYEVNNDYYHNFIDENHHYQQFFMPSTKLSHHMFDLGSLVAWQLRQHNINDILAINQDTYANSDKYPSYRRSQHQGEQHYEHRILSTIMIK